ncbi:hypothetical protein [uncultured Cetobacterium sp.]|uniref:hypothetical protein n=1 Tax=uncultured Cetobacterium sp. TaxID=527638 RepID=UPI0026091076|nr:hypothetical protein [uncultured Cetobacterium sp.]
MKNLKKNVFILGTQISESISAKEFKISGDILLDSNGAIALYLYRHAIELELKFLSEKLNVFFKSNYNMKRLFDNLKTSFFGINTISKENIFFIEEIIKDYIALDETSVNLRYSNSIYEENFILSEKFINKNIINNIDDPYLYEIKKKETKENINELFEILTKINNYIDKRDGVN